MFRLTELNVVNSEFLGKDWDKHRISLVENTSLICDRWLFESQPKRRIFDWCYGDLLETSTPTKVLDVGGGIHSFSVSLARNCNYTLIETLDHASNKDRIIVESLKTDNGVLLQGDWHRFEFNESYDVCIANDIFPNVDFRLEQFLNKCNQSRIPEIRLVLTILPGRKSYHVQRVGLLEQMTVLSMSVGEVEDALALFLEDRVQLVELVQKSDASLYPNGRQVYCLRLELIQ
jgi:2-polyprenyl-3-methyl-5-hydroxy-6-metoxy-1,4-benzoquinol methylase